MGARGTDGGTPPARGVWEVLADLVAGCPLLVIGLDEARRIRLVSPSAAELVGRDAGDLVGRSVTALFPDAEAAVAAERIDEAARERQHVELTLRTSDGRRVPIGSSWWPVDVAGGASGVLGIGRDITGRKTVEHELARYASSFQALAEGTDLGMYRWSFRPELHVDYVNPAFEAAVGYTLGELNVDPSLVWRSIPAEAAERVDRSRRHPDSADWPIEFPWQRPDGEVRWLQIREAQLRSPDGRLEAVIGVLRDVTAQHRQEQAQAETLRLEREAVERLRRIDELRRLFLQAVSHELRTPLTSVLGFTATLHDRFDDLTAADARILVERARHHAERIQRLLDDLLDVERLARGVANLQVAPVDLAQLVEAAAAEEGDGGVELDLEPVVAEVDAPKVERVVVNLLANARRHAGDDPYVRITLRVEDDEVVLLVDDDGPGVPDGLKPEIFEPFTQGDRAAGQASPGTGIGLTLVAEFARLHGGTAHVEDSPLGGARFVVRLPRDVPPSGALDPATDTVAASLEVQRPPDPAAQDDAAGSAAAERI